MTEVNAPSEWPWPDDLDAMIAAHGFHAVLFEDDRVRVLDGRVPPGATVPVHTHRWGGVLYVLATSDFVRRDPDGNVLADTRVSKSTPIVGYRRLGRCADPALFGERRQRGIPHAHRGDERRRRGNHLIERRLALTRNDRLSSLSGRFAAPRSGRCGHLAATRPRATARAEEARSG